LRRARSEADVRAAIVQGPLIARGNGRAYGDAAMNTGLTLDMRGLDRMLSFDAETGVLVAEAGVLLGDIIAALLPRGWFPMVTPGTKFITLGGAIAADVHGKNHHGDGSFRACVDWVDLMGADGRVSRVAPGDDLFDWTLGGMGLTGVILRAQIRLRAVESAWIAQDLHPTSDLAEAMDRMDAALDVPYSVAWIDCATRGAHMGRSIVMLGRHATLDDLPEDKRAKPYATRRKPAIRLPIDLPAFLLNPLTLRLGNAAYYWNGRRMAGRGLVDWDSYFYPLDAILDWNRGYGRRGFYQFQCALPLDRSRAGMAALIEAIATSGQGSPLAVLKRFGAEDGRFSFPMAGYTLALDFPANRRSERLMQRLDDITLAHGGRFYLAKDGRMSKQVFEAADPRGADFAAMRKDTGLAARFTSLQSDRLGL
jgi:FAD/FMN-containing dehydrogenase